MTAIVFAGPSVPPGERPALPGLAWRPPLRMGELARAAADERPAAIGVIDGVFEVVPTVWHKEILWVMAQGIAVYGAASIGALRAAELAPFGMRGVGAIFAAYRDGTLIDDDEVALLHGPEEAGFPAVTEAMVNVRATLQAARAAGVVTAADAADIAVSAKAIFYKDRTWPTVLQTALAAGSLPAAGRSGQSTALLHRHGQACPDRPRLSWGRQSRGWSAFADHGGEGNDESRSKAAGIASATLDALAAWLPSGRLDQKRRDALAMVGAIAEHLASGMELPAVNYELAVTSALVRVGLTCWAGARSCPAGIELSLRGRADPDS